MLCKIIARAALASAAVLALAGGPAFAQAKAQALAQSPAAPDWSGVWIRIGSPTDTGDFFNLSSPPAPSTWPPLTPEYRARYAAQIDGLKRGVRLFDPTSNCLPPGMPWMMNMPYPMQILQAADQMVIIGEWEGQIRRIYTDGRKPPEDLDRTYNGYSTGHWDKGVLTVETVGLRGDTALNDSGLQHSDQMTVRERFSINDKGQLVDEITTVDPKTFTTPWVQTKTYKRAPKGMEMREYVCENNRDALK